MMKRKEKAKRSETRPAKSTSFVLNARTASRRASARKEAAEQGTNMASVGMGAMWYFWRIGRKSVSTGADIYTTRHQAVSCM